MWKMTFSLKECPGHPGCWHNCVCTIHTWVLSCAACSEEVFSIVWSRGGGGFFFYLSACLNGTLAPLQSDSPEEEELRLTLNSLSAELHKLDDIHWICPLMQCSEEVRSGSCGRGARSLCLHVWENPLCTHTHTQYSTQYNPLVHVHVRCGVRWCFQESVRSSGKSGGSSMKLKIIPKVKKEREKLHKQKSNSSLSGKSSGQRHACRQSFCNLCFSACFVPFDLRHLLWCVHPSKPPYEKHVRPEAETALHQYELVWYQIYRSFPISILCAVECVCVCMCVSCSPTLFTPCMTAVKESQHDSQISSLCCEREPVGLRMFWCAGSGLIQEFIDCSCSS